MNILVVSSCLVLPVFAGMLVAFAFTGKGQRNIKLLLSFGGAFLLGISFLHLIPEIYNAAGYRVGFFVLAGFLLQLLLEFLSQGVEHGHFHSHSHEKGFPALVFISLCLHAVIEAFPINREWIPLHTSTYGAHVHSGISLLTGIALHNIPLGIALASTLVSRNISRTRVLFWITLFALCGPAGAISGEVFNTELLAFNPKFFDYTMGLVIGMFLHIATTILFETSEGHRFNAVKLIAVLLGFAFATVSSLV